MTTEKDLEIAFMGTPQIGADILSGLIDSGLKFSAVITRPDRPKGRSDIPSESPVKIVAKKHNLPVYQPENKEELTKIMKELKPDLGVIAAFGMIIPEEALNLPKHGLINFHPSLLPLYRGPAPVAAPILAGDSKTGVTVIKVSKGMDEGDILGQEEIPLPKTITAPELENALSKLGARMLVTLIPKYVSGELSLKPQDHKKATYTHLVKKRDGQINFSISRAEDIEKAERAYTPWPGVYTFWNSKKLDLYELTVIESDLSPGSVAQKNGQLLIGTKKDAISPKYLKIEGKNKVTASDFLRGYPDFLGADLSQPE